MHTVMMTVTKPIADRWLGNNAGNRNINQSWVAALASMMRHGEFQTTHQGILIGPGGALMDGQHRLLAISRCGVACVMNVTTDETCISARGLKVDIGVMRTAAFIYDISAKKSGVASFLGRILAGRIVTKAELGPYINLIEPSWHDLIPVGRETAAKTFSSAPVTTAALVHVRLHPEHTQYYQEVYSALTRNDPKNLAPKPYSLWRQFSEKRGYENNDLYIRAIRALDYETKDLSKLQYKNRELAWDEAVALTKQAFPY